ncbi:MAG TPA: hypothetical protein VFE91_05190 [Nitrososphaerales archaeon]|nr:hypothetical protein [Nitrososphaerales archaeon]
MSNLVILVWQHREMGGDPDVEVRIPTNLVKWVPKLMRFVPKKTKDETWGEGVDFDGMMADLDELVKEATASGKPELMTVKTKDAFVKMTVEN